MHITRQSATGITSIHINLENAGDGNLGYEQWLKRMVTMVSDEYKMADAEKENLLIRILNAIKITALRK